jgi:hypothetical protein
LIVFDDVRHHQECQDCDDLGEENFHFLSVGVAIVDGRFEFFVEVFEWRTSHFTVQFVAVAVFVEVFQVFGVPTYSKSFSCSLLKTMHQGERRSKSLHKKKTTFTLCYLNWKTQQLSFEKFIDNSPYI